MARRLLEGHSLTCALEAGGCDCMPTAGVPHVCRMCAACAPHGVLHACCMRAACVQRGVLHVCCCGGARLLSPTQCEPHEGPHARRMPRRAPHCARIRDARQ